VGALGRPGGPAGPADRASSRRLLRDVSLGQAAITTVLALTFGGSRDPSP
jgi:hypothetical protein